ncbi:zincin-like metallopeptidase domain-containing protein [Tenacibaculum sp. MAR_2009_124]|uniref:zincin-like metallopeptidase domain-containing protein n=1 Tax=Tenacibaculum sp. MAR_2009_124 TaxID=1250059 RepID=UPI000B8A3E53|nr:zincin-like metallopeptidase domain-containing protein [Tenacibaculum sp. MAR_2009_124]
MSISLETLIPEIQQKANFLHPDSILENFPNAPALQVGAFAKYEVQTDTIYLPEGIEKPYYYRLLFHELAHSLVHPSRLNLNSSGTFKSYPYVLEEITAELTAIILCAKTQQYAKNAIHHVNYINAWYKILARNRKKYAFSDLKKCVENAHERVLNIVNYTEINNFIYFN